MRRFTFLAAGAILGLGQYAWGDLILTSTTPIPSTGNGLGSVTTILTVTSPGSTTGESGCVGKLGINNCPDATSSWAFTGQTQTGASQTGLRALSALNITNANQLGFIFNATQPSGSGITLQELNVLFYTSSGGVLTLLDDARYTTPTVLTNTLTGIGNAGYLFVLNTAEQNTINAALASGATILMGGSFTAGCGSGVPNLPACNSTTELAASGGHDVLQVATINGGGVTSSVPEPAAYAMIGAGLLGLGLYSRRRNGSA